MRNDQDIAIDIHTLNMLVKGKITQYQIEIGPSRCNACD